jgi:hypothetical protein
MRRFLGKADHNKAVPSPLIPISDSEVSEFDKEFKKPQASESYLLNRVAKGWV